MMQATAMVKTKTRIEYPVFIRTRDLSHLSRGQRILWHIWFRFSLFCAEMGLPSLVAPDGTRIALQGIGRSEAEANAMTFQLGEDAFWKKGPVGALLPKGEVVFGGNQMPQSENAALLKKIGCDEVPTLCPVTQELCKPHECTAKTQLITMHNRASELLEEAKRVRTTALAK